MRREEEGREKKKEEGKQKTIRTTELELINSTVSWLLRQIASVLRCVKNKTFPDNILNPIIVRYQ